MRSVTVVNPNEQENVREMYGGILDGMYKDATETTGLHTVKGNDSMKREVRNDNITFPILPMVCLNELWSKLLSRNNGFETGNE